MKNSVLLLFLLTLFCFFRAKCSNIPIRPVNKAIEIIIYQNKLSGDQDIRKIQTEIRKLSKDNNELSNAYYCLADLLYKNADYSNTVLMFKKVDSITIHTGNREDRIMANLFLANIYGKLALKKQAEERYDIAEKLIRELNIPDALLQLEYQKSAFLEENMQWCDAVPLKQHLITYFESKVREGKEKRYKINLAVTYTELAYTLLKCNDNISEAKIYLQKYEEIFSHHPKEKNNLLPQYYIDKGIISAEENDMEKAKYWFELAYESAESLKLETLRLRCQEEQIRYGLLDNASKKAYLDAYLLKKNAIKEHSEKVIASEHQLFIQKESEKTWKNTLFIVVLSALFTTAVLLYYRKRQYKLTRRFEEIIEKAREEKEVSEETEDVVTTKIVKTEVKTNQNNTTKEKTEKIMSEEKEKELLMKIEEFEKTEIFTDEKFTMGKFASALESNAKYINYVLQKYKGNTFSDYLNDLRIKFIVNKLIEHPEYLNYKISYLAKISGFTSHSRFTYIFKSVLNISPSEFISQLNKQKKSKNSA